MSVGVGNHRKARAHRSGARRGSPKADDGGAGWDGGQDGKMLSRADVEKVTSHRHARSRDLVRTALTTALSTSSTSPAGLPSWAIPDSLAASARPLLLPAPADR